MARNQTLTNRVAIRPPTAGDCAAFIAAVRRSRSLHHPRINPKARTGAAFAAYLKTFSSPSKHGFFVVHRETGDLVGMINLNNVDRSVYQSAKVGYYAFLPHAGQGLMHEGLLLVLKYAFQKLKLQRVEADIQPVNHASRALAKSCGFVQEGFSRRFAKVCGEWKDHERWAIIAGDFHRIKSSK